MRVASKERYLLKAFGLALIVMGSIGSPLAVYTLISDFNSLSSFGGWWMTATMIAMTIESLMALLMGIISVSRQDKFLLVLGSWSVLFLAERIFRVIPMFGLSIGSIGYMAWHFASPCAFLVAFVYLHRTRHAWNISISGPLCLQCRYNLCGLREPRCPECGRVYTLDEFYHL